MFAASAADDHDAAHPEIRSDEAAPLSEAEVAQFREHGFLAIPELCSATEQRWIRATLLALFERHAGRNEGNQFDMLGLDREAAGAVQPQIVQAAFYAPELLKTAYYRRVQAIARQLLGADAQFSFDHSIVKPAGSGAATPWHQDEAHRTDLEVDYRQISFWMPLQQASLENGCMRYVPGSNRGALLAHRSLNDDPRIHALECPTGHFDEAAAVACPVGAGSCILHDGRTLHSALPNVSGGDRLAYVLAFRSRPIPRAIPRPAFPWLAGKATAGTERGSRWRRRGGVLVMALRRLRRSHLLAGLREPYVAWQSLLRLMQPKGP